MAQMQFRSDDTEVWTRGFGDGSDGALTISGNTTDAPIDSSCSGTSTTTSLSATNTSFAAGQCILIHQTRGTGAGVWELNKISGYTAGTITTKYALKNTYTDSGASQAQVIVLKEYASVTVNTGVTWSAKAWDGNVGGILAFLCKGTTNIVGAINLTGKGYRGGTCGANDQTSRQGEGTSGDRNGNSTATNGSGAGGGEIGFHGSKGSAGGGGGGHAANGTIGSNGQASPGGAGGLASGNAGLTIITFGGSGGAGGGMNYAADPGDGGYGGGIGIIITKDISISGSINTNATNGTNGDNDVGGGGGGAGGAVLIKAQTAALGTNKLTAAAGSKGAGGSWSGAGGPGSVGRFHIDYKTSVTGSASPAIDAVQDTSLNDNIDVDFIPKVMFI